MASVSNAIEKIISKESAVIESQKDRKIKEQEEIIETFRHENFKLKKKVKELRAKLKKIEESEISTVKKETSRNSRGIEGIGHFYENDAEINEGGDRDHMIEDDIRRILTFLSVGGREVNLKIWWSSNFEYEEGGLTLKFKSARKNVGGDGFYYLSCYRRYAVQGDLRFKAVCEEIGIDGKVGNRKKLESQQSAGEQSVKSE